MRTEFYCCFHFCCGLQKIKGKIFPPFSAARRSTLSKKCVVYGLLVEKEHQTEQYNLQCLSRHVSNLLITTNSKNKRFGSKGTLHTP